MTAAADSTPDTPAPEAADSGASEAPETAAAEPAAGADETTAAVPEAIEPEPADAEPADAPEAEPADVEPADAEPTADAPEAEPATADAPAPRSAPTPASVATPGPRPTPSPRPAPSPRPPATRAPASAPASSDEPWGRVTDDGTVSVREGDQWREVGQYPDGSPEEALAYFERKYADLAAEVSLLEVRHRRGGAAASDLRATAIMVRDKVAGAAAVGDLAGLTARLTVLTEELAAASASEAAAAREAVDDAIRVRTELVEQAEALAARDPRSVQWKQASSELTSLFDRWQHHQQTGPRLPKAVAQQLWKRFRDARAIVDKHRREFYAELDETHRAARDRKTRLVERAEALAPRGEDGIGDYRALLDQWKAAGRAGKKADDALWARFKAAGDALYGARIEREAADTAASVEKIEEKKALLEEARGVADVRELAKARSILTGIQRRWDEVGRIFPRETERGLDDELRRIEQALRQREEVDWKRNNPETKARANDMTRQLTDAIDKLEAELAAAEKSGDASAAAKAREALEARRTWLAALGGS